MKGIFVDVKDVAAVTGLSYPRAVGHLQDIHAALAKAKHQKVTVTEFCNYEGIQVDDFHVAIAPALKK